VGPISSLAPRAAVNAEQGQATDPPADRVVDWRAALTAECGFYAAWRLHRLTRASDVTPELVRTAPERTLGVRAGDTLTVTAMGRRWVPRS
jgi:hypothetical protein